jgi:methionine-rich copper-binding protein CopC
MTPRQRSLTALSTAAVALGLVLGAAAPAAAHNYVVSSTPAEGETLTALPAEWEIVTNESLLDLGGQGAGFGIVVSDADGQFYGDGCVTVSGPGMAAPAALGESGAYLLTYQFVSADGHTLSGEIPFTWQAPAGFEAHVGLAEPPVCGETASAPAPVETAEPTTAPEPAPDSTTEPEVPAESADEGTAVLLVAGLIVLALAVGGVLIAVIIARRRSATDPSARRPGDAPVIATDSGTATRQETRADDTSSADGSSGDGGGGGGD